MILDIEICNNKQPQLPVIVVSMYMQDVYKHWSRFRVIWKDLVQIRRAKCKIPGGALSPLPPLNRVIRSYSVEYNSN
jgi:hypothetical protein